MTRSWSNLNAILKFLQSRNFLLVILIALAVVVVIGTLVPQRVNLDQKEFEAWMSRNPTFGPLFNAAAFTHIFSSWWFTAVLVALFLSLAACEYTQIKTAYKSLKIPFVVSRDLDMRLPFEKRIAGTTRNKAAKQLKSELERRRFKVIGKHFEGESKIRARRFYFAWLGSPLFHMGLIFILIGGILSVTTRAEGYIELAEGQTFKESHQNYLRLEEGPLFREQHKGFQIRLDQFIDKYWPDGSLRRVQSKITLINRGRVVRKELIEVNEPLIYRGATVYQNSSRFGYATQLTLELKDQPGSSGLVLFPRAKKGTAETIIYLPGTIYEIDSRLFYQKKPPHIQIRIRKQEQTLYTGVLKFGDEVRFENNSLRFDKLVRWSGFSVIHDRGVGIVFNSFWLSFGALLLIIFFSPQELIFNLTEQEEGVLIRAGGRGKRSRLPWGQNVEATVKEVLSSFGP